MIRRAFTLIELLLVLAIITILAATLFRLLQPTTHLEKAYDTSRKNAQLQIASAASQFMIDVRLLTDLPESKETAIDVCRESVVGINCTGAPVSGYDLSAVVPTYITALPVDPLETDWQITGYRIYKENSFTRVCAYHVDPDCGSDI